MTRYLLPLLALLPACTQAKAPAPQPAQAPAKPALWKIVDPDTTIYLFGTIHALPPGTRWQSPTLRAAMARSDSLVLEVGNLGDTAALTAAFQSLAVSPGLPPVLTRVAPAKRKRLEAALTAAKLPIAAADRMESWAVALSLVAATVPRLGFSREAGVEAKLRAAFDARGVKTEGLETAAQQFGYFDGLSESAQRRLLEAALEDEGKAKLEFARMLAAWRVGDVARIALTFDDELKTSPELTKALLDRRNAAWVEWLAARMKAPGTVFVAVGAGHLAGRQSLTRLATGKGLRVLRVQ